MARCMLTPSSRLPLTSTLTRSQTAFVAQAYTATRDRRLYCHPSLPIASILSQHDVQYAQLIHTYAPAHCARRLYCPKHVVHTSIAHHYHFTSAARMPTRPPPSSSSFFYTYNPLHLLAQPPTLPAPSPTHHTPTPTMHLPALLLLLAAAPALTAAASLASRALPSGTVTCGSNKYAVSALTAAINAGVKDKNSGNLPDNYPHQYYDEPSEHITLYCSGSGPWYEFPLMPDGSIYTSTSSHYVSPGTDRVIFTASGTYCAVVTHTGAASEDGFVACKGD
ncbi:Ribonuclease/ribotoxin [Trametopsis cervina]|nr:Ribonuclease/ribotoxin [Trametopsis cervina]